MKTLRHPYSILTPEKPELKSRYPPKNKGFEELDLTRGESKLWAKSHWAVPLCYPSPQPITQRRRMHLEAYVGGVSCPIRTSCSKRERSRWQNIVEQRKDLCSGCAYSPATTLSLYVMTGPVQTLPSTTSASSSSASLHICHIRAKMLNMLAKVFPVQRAALWLTFLLKS